MATTAKPKPAARKRTARKTAARTSRAGTTNVQTRSERMIKDARKRGEQLLTEARRRGERAVKEAEKTMESAREQTQKRAARLAMNVVDFQKSTFDSSIDALGRLQKRSDKLVRRAVKDATWMPGEGKDVVEEWVSTMEKARADFKRTTDKSFDLVLRYLKRLERGDGAAKKPAKKSTKKKAAAKRKTARKKPAKRQAKSKAKTKTKTKSKAKASSSAGTS